MNEQLPALLKELDSWKAKKQMPVIFVGHGSPLNAINDSAYTQTWRALGSHLPKPRAIVCMSAHWLTEGTFVGAMAQPELIYDFYGFPPELYAVRYPPPGSPHVAEELQALMPEIQFDTNRGLDHGVWTVLMHLFPNADIPIIPLSIDFAHDRAHQYSLMQKLSELRKKGILFIGSGNAIHNLGMMRSGSAYPWAESFDGFLAEKLMSHDHQTLIEIEKHHPEATQAVPFDDHYRPMLNTLALTKPEEEIFFFNEAVDLGSVGMRSFVSMQL